MQIFFVVIGPSANVMTVLRAGSIRVCGCDLVCSFAFSSRRRQGVQGRSGGLVIASNANMGGPTTTAAMAVARKWHVLVIPAILCGTLGYAVATFIGVAVGFWLQ